MLIHCPNCGNLVNGNNKFCPVCGYHLQNEQINHNYNNIQQPIPSRKRPPHRHHTFRNTAIVIILLALGVGGAYIYNNGNNNSQGTSSSRQAGNKPSSNSATTPNNSSNGQNQTNKSNQSKPNNQEKPSKAPTRKIPSKSAKNTTNSQIKAKPGYTSPVFPKNIQGTWYTYDQGKLLTMTISSNKMVVNGKANGLHARKIDEDAMKAPEHPNWMIGLYPPKKVHGLKFFQTLGYNQSAGDGESFVPLHVKGMIVLEEAGGADNWLDNNFFQSKSQAQQNKKKVFPHEVKR